MAKPSKNTPRPRWENLASEIAASFRHDQLVKILVEQHEIIAKHSEYLKGAAKGLSWMIPAIAVDGHVLGELAIGVKIYENARDPTKDFGIRIKPPKLATTPCRVHSMRERASFTIFKYRRESSRIWKSQCSWRASFGISSTPIPNAAAPA